MQELVARVLNARRNGWVRARPMFEPFAPVGTAEIEQAERKTGALLPEDLKAWLLAVGYGDVNARLSFRQEWFHRIEDGSPAGLIIFAQDDSGNFYAFSPSDESIFFLSRSSPEYAKMTSNFRAFMEELERRDFQLEEWANSLSLVANEG